MLRLEMQIARDLSKSRTTIDKLHDLFHHTVGISHIFENTANNFGEVYLDRIAEYCASFDEEEFARRVLYQVSKTSIHELVHLTLEESGIEESEQLHENFRETVYRLIVEDPTPLPSMLAGFVPQPMLVRRSVH